MTLAVIVACKDHFYMISDSLTQGDSDFTLNTQKYFFSQKHKIGMCIAGDAVLKFNGISCIQEVIYVDFLIKEFFNYIETLKSVPVETLSNHLDTFFTNKYPQYSDCFKKSVTYYYGGFINSGDNSTTIIYSHDFERNDEGTRISDTMESKRYSFLDADQTTPCFFANTDAALLNIERNLNSPESQMPPGTTQKKILTELTFRRHFLEKIIPSACFAFNHKHPYSIGKHLHYTKIQPATAPVLLERVIHWTIEANTLKTCQPDLDTIPPYVSHRSLQESNRAFWSGKQIKYSIQDGSPIDNRNSAAAIIQSYAKGIFSRNLAEKLETSKNSSAALK